MDDIKARRQKATEYFVNLAKAVAPNTKNAEIIQQQLGRLTDQQFHDLMVRFKNGDDHLRLVLPNSGERIDVERMLNLGEKMGIQFWERIKMTDPATGVVSYTNKPALLLCLPARRQSQLQRKKESVAADNQHIDTLTGQPTGDSKGSSISFPQMLIFESRGLRMTATEFAKIRGGDEKAFMHSNRMIYERGEASIDDLKELGGKVKSTAVLSAYLKAQHLDNNL